MSRFLSFLASGVETLIEIHTENNKPKKESVSPDEPGWVVEVKDEIHYFFENHNEETVGDCKNEIRKLINSCCDKAYQNGGNDMFDGIKRNNPDVSWE